jgi:GH25 family lysozyme M1 (1,4-beta-N-acetylmuramidase)
MTIRIIDISYWQTPSLINYAELAKHISGVILRAAYSTSKYTRFDAHYMAFDDLGVPIGAYHYIVGSATPRGQAEALAAAIQGKQMRLGVWNDVEDQRHGLTRDIVLAYHAEAEKLIGEMGVYTSAYKWDTIMGRPDLSNRKLWVANYGVSSPMLPRTGGWKAWWLWQYAEDGRLPGYDRKLDLNHFWGDEEYFYEWIGDPSPEYPEPTLPEGTMYVIEMLGHLRIRKGPGEGYDQHHEKYALLGETHHSIKREADQTDLGGFWYQITAHGVTGWIHGGRWTRITVIEPDPEPEPQPPDPPLTLEERVARLWEAVFG